MTVRIPSKDWPIYLRWMLATLTTAIVAVGAFNVFVDPLGVFGSPRLVGGNVIKPYLDHHREFSRWHSARRICANAGIFGNSRAEIGFDPENMLFAKNGLSAFNHAIPGSSANLAYQQINWLKSAGCMPGTVFLAVEFFDFLGGSMPRPLPSLESKSIPQIDGKFLAETVFSVTGLRDSIGTLLLQHNRYPAMLTERGFNPIYNYIPEVERSGQYILFRQRAEESAQIWMRKLPRLRPVEGGLSDDEHVVDAILDSTTRNGSTVYVIIYPYHAQIRMMIERLGFGALFAEWKKIVVNLAAMQNLKGGKVEVWDFSGISPEITEEIPPRGDRRTHLKYYWESGHFKKALGDRVLARLFGDENQFGRKLDSNNVDGWVVEDRNQVQALLEKPSPLLAEVEDILALKARKR